MTKEWKEGILHGSCEDGKSHMVRAVDCDMPGWLDGLTLAAGKQTTLMRI
ncbi:hypothetical protein SP39_7 [Salmonella phage 39]|nr:hypothetical protein SP39_7 [Salmonella phage 39]